LLFLDLTLRAIREIRGGLMNLGPPEFQVAREGAGMSAWRAYCNDQALISQAWRAGESPSRVTPATALERL